MNNTEVIFEDIEQRILTEIKNARYAIFVSVAWFTNKRLFEALLTKAKENCYVSVIIQLDEINSQSGIDFNQIKIGRSECFFIPKEAELLHDKFCVIDFKKVITGSYNWTYKASRNSENIVIITDTSISSTFITRFEQQKMKNKILSTNFASNEDNKTIPIYEWVDLGLPSGIKWAKYNIGASQCCECGDYFAWGEIQPKKIYIKDNLIFRSRSFIKLEDAQDAARKILGKEWRMPTQKEFWELITLCKRTIEKNGFLFTGPNGASIIFPYGGYKHEDKTEHFGAVGAYWASDTLDFDTLKYLGSEKCSYSFYFHNHGGAVDLNARYLGFNIRPVYEGSLKLSSV